MTSIEDLAQEAANLGQDRIIFPIDILELANTIASHSDRLAAVPSLVALLAHESNFQRHIALRALRLIGPEALTVDVVNRATQMIASDDAPNLRAEAVRLIVVAQPNLSMIRETLIKAAAEDDTDYVRVAAADALHQWPPQ